MGMRLYSFMQWYPIEHHFKFGHAQFCPTPTQASLLLKCPKAQFREPSIVAQDLRLAGLDSSPSSARELPFPGPQYLTWTMMQLNYTICKVELWKLPILNMYVKQISYLGCIFTILLKYEYLVPTCLWKNKKHITWHGVLKKGVKSHVRTFTILVVFASNK